ncbi:MAG TPA: efflux RND transporter periplasmic adaptor subunit, partial [Elusimicrobiota bacterium]|nr:efflux RND transporter periplasmic adaptor subunit [Elusimicrobiota bacterium]
TVSAPLAGVVLRCLKGGKDAEPSFSAVGDYVTGSFESQSPTCLMTIADMSRLVVRLKISEMDILKLEAGMPVRVSVDALPGASFPGKVSLVAPQAEKESTGGKFFRVEVELDRADRRLKSGMTAQVDALLSRRQDVLKIPAAAVFEEEGRTVVYVGSPARAVPVEVGLRTDMEAEIRSGLEEGQRVFVERPGAPGGAS